MTLSQKRHSTLQQRPPVEPEQKTDHAPDNPPEGAQPNSDLPEIAQVVLHDDMESEQIPDMGIETHVPVKPEQKMDLKPDDPLEGGKLNADLPEIAAVAVDINLEEIPVHVLGLNAIKKGDPIARGGMSTVFNGKYGPIPVALKQAVDSVQMLVNEAAIITKMHHPNVIQAYGIWTNAKQEVFMVCVILCICVADIAIGIANFITTLACRCWSSVCTETSWRMLRNL